MVNLNSAKRICISLILFLSVMHVESQNTLIDTIQQTTHLDHKATIANGNLLLQGAKLDTLYRDSKIYSDSLKSEISILHLEVQEYKEVKVPTLERVITEVKFQSKVKVDKSNLIIGGLETDLKSAKQAKWKIGGILFILGLIFGVVL